MNIESVKTFFTAIREAIIVGLFLLILIVPGTFNNMLTKAGFTKGNLLGFDWEKTKEETVGAAQEVSELNNGLVALQEKLVAAQEQPPTARQESYKSIGEELTALISKSEAADGKLKSSLISQQRVIEASGQSITAHSGWVGVGLVDETKKNWRSEDAKTVTAEFPALVRGTTLTFTTDAYVRSPPRSPSDFHSTGKILFVLKAGESARIVGDLDYVPIRPSGYSIWAYVEL